MKVLIVYASRHGSTKEIAEAIGGVLELRGLDAKVVDAAMAFGILSYDAIIVGSAVFSGKWMQSARSFVEIYKNELAQRPLWLFSSGPIGEPLKPADDEAVHIQDIAAAVGAREHQLFAGKLDKGTLGFGERALATAVRAQEGDFRNWDTITAWANHIADALETTKEGTSWTTPSPTTTTP